MRTAMLLLLLAGAGCASISNVQTADTLGKGNYQVGIEPGAWGVATSSGTGFVPHLDASFRFGVSDSVDLGVRGGFSFLELQGKFLLTDPKNRHLAVSLAPTIGGLVAGSTAGGGGWLNIGVPVLVGLKLPGGSEVVIGPRLQNLLVLSGTAGSTGGAVYGLAVGSSLGFAWRISDTFGLMPEVSAVFPVLGGSTFAGATQSVGGATAGAAIVQFKLGFLVGGFRPLAASAPQGPVPVANPPLPPPPPPPPGDLSPPPPPPAG